MIWYLWNQTEFQLVISNYGTILVLPLNSPIGNNYVNNTFQMRHCTLTSLARIHIYVCSSMLFILLDMSLVLTRQHYFSDISIYFSGVLTILCYRRGWRKTCVTVLSGRMWWAVTTVLLSFIWPSSDHLDIEHYTRAH